MNSRNNDLTKTQQAMLLAVLEALKTYACISSYTTDATKWQPAWTEDGFDRAFQEIQTNPHPFGLKKKGEKGLLHLLLARKNKNAVDDLVINSFRQQDVPRKEP